MSGVPASNFHGNVVPLRSAEVDLADHVAAGHERRHRLEQLPPRPERARARRAEHLVPGERVEVGADRLDIDGDVRHGLCAVDQDQRAGLVGLRGHLGDRVDGAEGVRDVGERHELRLQPEQDVEHVLAEDPVVGDRDELEVAVHLLREELPRDEVRVVLHLGEHDRVAARDVAAAPRVGDEVDRLGGVAGEDDLVAVGGVDEPGHGGASRLERRRRPLADLVDPAMDVGRVLAVVAVERVDDDLGLLARRGRIEEDQRLAVNLRLEHREVAPDDLRVQLAVANSPVEGRVDIR